VRCRHRLASSRTDGQLPDIWIAAGRLEQGW
jgi:hypothetical protein